MIRLNLGISQLGGRLRRALPGLIASAIGHAQLAGRSESEERARIPIVLALAVLISLAAAAEPSPSASAVVTADEIKRGVDALICEGYSYSMHKGIEIGSSGERGLLLLLEMARRRGEMKVLGEKCGGTGAFPFNLILGLEASKDDRAKRALEQLAKDPDTASAASDALRRMEAQRKNPGAVIWIGGSDDMNKLRKEPKWGSTILAELPPGTAVVLVKGPDQIEATDDGPWYLVRTIGSGGKPVEGFVLGHTAGPDFQ